MSWTRNSLCTVHSRAVFHLNAAATSKATAIIANGTATTKNNYLALLILALLLRKSDTATVATAIVTALTTCIYSSKTAHLKAVAVADEEAPAGLVGADHGEDLNHGPQPLAFGRQTRHRAESEGTAGAQRHAPAVAA